MSKAIVPPEQPTFDPITNICPATSVSWGADDGWSSESVGLDGGIGAYFSGVMAFTFACPGQGAYCSVCVRAALAQCANLNPPTGLPEWQPVLPSYPDSAADDSTPAIIPGQRSWGGSCGSSANNGTINVSINNLGRNAHYRLTLKFADNQGPEPCGYNGTWLAQNIRYFNTPPPP